LQWESDYCSGSLIFAVGVSFLQWESYVLELESDYCNGSLIVRFGVLCFGMGVSFLIRESHFCIWESYLLEWESDFCSGILLCSDVVRRRSIKLYVLEWRKHRSLGFSFFFHN